MKLLSSEVMALAAHAGLAVTDKDALMTFADMIAKTERQGCVQTLNDLFKVLPTEHMETVAECVFAIESR